VHSGRPAGRRREQVDQPGQPGGHGERRQPLPRPEPLPEQPRRQDQGEGQLKHQDGLDHGELPGTERARLEQEPGGDGHDPAEPHRLVQQDPDLPQAQVLALRYPLVRLALQHGGDGVRACRQHRESVGEHRTP